MLRHGLNYAALLIGSVFIYTASAHPGHEHRDNHNHDIKEHVIDELRRQHPTIDIIGEVVEQHRHQQQQQRYERRHDHSHHNDRHPHDRHPRHHEHRQQRDRHHDHYDDRPRSRPSSSRDFGISYINDRTLRVYHADYGWTASFRYLCLNDQCYTAHRDGGYYVYDFPARRGNSYTIKIKVQDEHTPGGQYIASKQVRF